jgi:pyruvate,water dikinase
METNENDTKEVSGQSACGSGVITGTCQLILDESKLSELREGSILVTVSTQPKYNHIYSRAKAIVMDGGSILSHAAILCREFDIPGIVGTKTATKIFKDGDRIEVNISNGTARKIDPVQ